MSVDISYGDLFSVIDKEKSIKKVQSRSKWLGRYQMVAGTYQMRFMAHELNCPRGFHQYTLHAIPKEVVQNKWTLTMDEREKAYYYALCTESTHGYRKVPLPGSTEEDPKFALKLAKPCPVCDFNHSFREDMGDELEDVDQDIIAAIDDMSANSSRTMLYPVLIYGEWIKQTVTNRQGVEKEKDFLIPSKTNCALFLFRLEVKNYDSNADLSLAKLISKVVMSNPSNLSLNDGCWFQYEKKSNSQNLTQLPPAPLGQKERELLKNFPDVINTNRRTDGGPYAKNYEVGYDKGLQLLKQGWFMPVLDSEYDYTLEGMKRGLV